MFFSFAGHLVGFILVGKVFQKAFRISELDERKGRWVVEQDFHAKFSLFFVCFFRKDMKMRSSLLSKGFIMGLK